MAYDGDSTMFAVAPLSPSLSRCCSSSLAQEAAEAAASRLVVVDMAPSFERRLAEANEWTDGRFDAVDERFSTTEDRIAAVERHIGAIDGCLLAIKERFGAIESRLLETAEGQAAALARLEKAERAYESIALIGEASRDCVNAMLDYPVGTTTRGFFTMWLANLAEVCDELSPSQRHADWMLRLKQRSIHTVMPAPPAQQQPRAFLFQDPPKKRMRVAAPLPATKETPLPATRRAAPRKPRTRT